MSLIFRNSMMPLALFVGTLILFTMNLASQEIVGFDSRFYLFALEMWRNGPTWFPTTYQVPYPDYPVTAIYLMYLMAALLGQMNKLAAVFPSAVAASVTVVMTYLIGELQSKRLGFYAVFFLLLTLAFLKSARSISLDMYTVMVTATCFYLIYSADIYHAPDRMSWIFPLFFIGFLFRGPIGLVVPTGVVCIYYFMQNKFKTGFLIGVLAFFILILSMALLLSLAYHVGESNFMYQVLHMQFIGRIDNKYHPFYYYFIQSLKAYALSYPTAFLVMISFFAAIYKKQKPPNSHLVWLLFAWVLIILIGMSIPGDKKIRYILPIAPALSLLAAYPFAIDTQIPFLQFIRKILQTIFLYFPAIFLLITETVFYYAKYNSVDFHIAYFPLALIFVVLQLFNFYLVYSYINKPLSYELKLFLMAALSWVIAYVFVIERIEIYYERGREFVRAIEMEREKQHADLVFYKEKPDGTPIKYLINSSYEVNPTFLADPKALLDFKRKAFFITSESNFADLPNETKSQFEIIGNDMMGHVRTIVFTKSKR